MVPASSFVLCVCPECSQETTPTRGVLNKYSQPSVPGRYWKKNTVTYRQHLEELKQNTSRGSHANTLSNVHAEVPGAKKAPPKIDVVSPEPKGGKLNQSQALGQDDKINGLPPNYPKSQLLRLPAQMVGAILLAVCQHLFFHLSIAAANSTLRVLRETTAFDRSNNESEAKFPITIETILSHLAITSEIHKKICCPKCFCLYPMDNKLDQCSFRLTPTSHRCQASLSVSSHQSGDKTNARPGEFAYQSLAEWLGKFLNRPGIEEHIESSVNQTSPNSAMEDIWHSPRWKEYKDSEGRQFTCRSNNLVFSLNVDWFNPSGNKIAGKHWSVGTIAMTCLNLPPLIRNRPENIFLAGLIPGPSEPKLEQINHLLQPLVSELLGLWKGCVIRPTFTSPIDGRLIRVRLGPVICDLPAIRKVLGLAGHSSERHLCQFCNVRKQTLDVVDIDRFKLRSGYEVKSHCLRWKKAKKVSQRERIFKRHGVRYSVLLQLPYFDPLDDAVVEPMHNIFLGLLRNHGTEFLGLKKKDERNNDQSDTEEIDRLEIQHNMSDVDYDENDADTISSDRSRSTSPQPITDLPPTNADDAKILEDSSNILEMMRCFEAFDDLTLFESNLEGTTSSDTRPSNAVSQAHLFASTDPHSNIYKYNRISKSLFSNPDNLHLLCSIIDEIRLPSHIGRVPVTVGKAKGGKLKAEEWINLFSILLIPTFFIIMKTSSSPCPELDSQFSNLLHLVSISNLVRQRNIAPEDIKALENHLKAYRQGILRLYPQFTTKPNHHLALHLPKCISRLGPAPYWTAWAFERLNGSLAKTPTNNQISKLNSTLLVKWTTTQNFRGILPSLCSQLPRGLADSIKNLSNPSEYQTSYSDISNGLMVNDEIHDQSAFNRTKELEHEDHIRLLKRLVEIDGHDLVGPEDCFRNWRKETGRPVLTRLIKYTSNISFRNFHFATRDTHPGNSTIHYLLKTRRNHSKLRYGQIVQIFNVSYQHEIDGPCFTETWLDVASFDELSSSDQKLNPLINFPKTHTHVNYQRQTQRHFVNPSEVLAQSTLWGAPGGTLGIKLPINIITNISNHLK